MFTATVMSAKKLDMSSQKKSLPRLYPLDRDIRKTWFIQFVGDDGLKKKAYGKLNHLKSVEEREIEAERIIASLDYSSAPISKARPAHLLHDLEEIIDYRKPGWNDKTYLTYFGQFTRFASWYRASGCPRMDALTAQQFLSWVHDGRSNTTRNTFRRNLKSLFLDLNRLKPARYPLNPFDGTRKLREAAKTKLWFRPFHLAQVRNTLQEKDPTLLLAVRLMYHCFTRPNELRQLQAGAFIFESGKLCVSSAIAKTDRPRYVPIPPELLPHLEFIKKLQPDTYLFTKSGEPGPVPCGRDTLSKRHAAVLLQLGYSAGFTFYSWKNTGAVKMMMQDRRSMRYISKCMGHHSLDMTDRYFESLGVDEMGEAIAFPEL
jgi:integrase